MPATANRDDIDAAREATFAVTDEMINNAWWMDPVYLGRYPQDGLRLYGADAPKVLPGDMDLIAQPLDLQAFNTYNGQLIRRGADGRPELVPHPTGYPMNFFHGSITPPCLYWTAKFMYERYRLPVVISENGMSNADWVGLDGRVPDGPRIDMLRRYLLELERAADEGVPVAGYFLWSLMDNFEWSHGYKQRFGIIHVDFVTGRRTLKDSALWYRDVIATHGGKLHEGL